MFDLGSAVGYLTLDTKGLESGFKKAEAGFKGFFDKSNKFGDRMSGLSSGLTNVGSAMTKGVTLPIIGAGSTMVAVASVFDSALSSIQAQTGATEEDMVGLEKVLDNIYKNNYGEGYEDIANSISKVKNSLGDISDEELQNVTESALALRDVFGVDVSESVRAVQALMKNFDITSEEAFDMIAEGFQNGLDFSNEFIDTLNEYSPQFKKMGLSAEDMFAIMQEGADTGAWNLDKVGDAMKELSIRVIDGSETTKTGFEQIGLNAEEMANKFAVGGESARSALQETVDALAAVEDPLQQNLAGVNLFGTMWEDLGPEVVLQMADIRDASYETAGAMDRLKDAKYDNLKSDLEELSRNFLSIAKDLGEILMPYVRDFVQRVQELVERFANMDEATQKVILAIAGVIALIGPLLSLFGQIAGIVSTVSGLIGGAGGLSAVMAALTGPIGLVIAAVGLLFAAWVTNFGGIRDATTSIFESISSIISSTWSFIVSLWDSNFLMLRTIVETWWTNLELYWGMIFDTISGIFEVFALVFQGDWQGAWDKVKEIFRNIFNTVVEILKNVLSLIIGIIINIGSSLYNAAKTAFGKVKEGFEYVWNLIMSWIGRVINDPVGTILDIGGALYDAGASIFQSLWDGLTSIWNQITSWVSDGISWLRSQVAFWESESSKINSGGGGSSRGGGAGRSVEQYHSAGIDYVPHDNYRSVLHEGEAVLTKQENEMRNKKYSDGDTFVFYSPEPIDEVTAAREFRRVKKEIAEDLLK